MRAVRVGIAIDAAAGDLALVRGNRFAWHLAETLRQIPTVDCVLVARDAADPCAALACCDLVIATCGQIDVAHIRDFRARGGRYVLFLRNNPYQSLVDQSLFDRGTDFGPVGCHDAIWVQDSFRAQVPVLRAIYRCPVVCLPLVWSASFVDLHNRAHGGDGWIFAGKPCAGPWRCVIDAANASVVDMGVLPLIAVNRFHADNPGAIARVEFRNAARLADRLTFNTLAASLELHREGRLTLWSDQDFYGLLPLHGDFVMSHRFDGAATCENLDTLFAGYPLVHNAPALADMGYYYPDGDIVRAVAQIGAMMRTQVADFDVGLANVRRALDRFAVDHPANVAAYGRALAA